MLKNTKKLKGCIKKCFEKNMRKELKLRIHYIISKAELQYSTHMWVLREGKRTEASKMRFLRPPVNISMRGKTRSIDTRKQVGTERIV
jgi:hypothetical protein